MNYNQLRQPITPPEDGKLFVNLTTRYLLPQMALFPEVMQDRMNATPWAAFGLADRNCPDYINYDEFDNKLFCLAYLSGDLHYWMKNHEYYLYLDGKADKMMFIIDLPINNRDDFLQGNYSKMYDKETIDKIIPKYIKRNGIEYMSSAYKVLTKSSVAREEFQEKVNEDFKLKPYFTVPEDQEYEYIPNMSREIFNYVQTNNVLVSV